MSVVFGYIKDNKVYLAADNRLTDINGNYISDDDIKIEVINNYTAVAFAGNHGAQNFFLKNYKQFDNYKKWFVQDLTISILGMCNSLIMMNQDWSNLISNSVATFLIAGKTSDNLIKLFAVTLKNSKIDCKEVPIMLFHPSDCEFKPCADILTRNIQFHFNDFAYRTINEISHISKMVSNTGNMWTYDLNINESTFVKI